MSETPRTSEEWHRIQRLPDGRYSSQVTDGDLAHGMCNFAKQLERELAKAREQLEDFEVEATNAINDIMRVKYQRDTLAEALKLCEKHLEKHGHEKCDEELDETGWWLLCDVRTALAAVKGGEA